MIGAGRAALARGRGPAIAHRLGLPQPTHAAAAPLAQLVRHSSGSFAGRMDNEITYSASWTIVPTFECFNRCSYCNFRAPLSHKPFLSLEEAEQQIDEAKAAGACELLVLSGEVSPNSTRRGEWFKHIYDICELALRKGMLPHTNAGPLSRDEMAKLKEVNASMGLMVESTDPALLSSVHRHAPSKRPELRLEQLRWAGELRVPFTTGILLGIGESEDHRRRSLAAIAESAAKYGHVQEVILQPFSPGANEKPGGQAPGAFNESGTPFDRAELPSIVEEARRMLPPDVTIQVPPNLVPSATILRECLEAGARDLGGLSPRDEVNPGYAFPSLAALREAMGPDWKLVERLPVYPQHDHWLGDGVFGAVLECRGRLGLLERDFQMPPKTCKGPPPNPFA
eukprot:tig00020710_g13270.t1